MIPPDPMEHLWWLSSRAAGIVALLAITASVGLGLAMAGRAVRRPWLHALHQQTALVGLVAIAVHGICLIGDAFLHPSLLDVAIPFRIEHERTWTALGVIGGWLAAILGLSYYARGLIGPQRWRTLHRATILVYGLSVAHTLGAGSDAESTWMRVLVLATGAPVLFLLLVRLLPAPKPTRRVRVASVVCESPSIVSVTFAGRLPRARAGQHLVLHLPGAPPRPYSISGPGPRISVKREPGGAVSPLVHALRPGDVVEVAGPRGDVVLDPRSRRPLLLLSAGIGITPVLAMLHELAARRSPREVWWVHTTREPAFSGEVDRLLAALPNAHRHVRRSDAAGRLDAAQVLALGVPRDADAVLCGPPAFLDALEGPLRDAGLAVRSERFGGAPSAAPRVEFRRSGVRAAYADGSLLELAEAHDVPAAAGCRAGSCGACRVPVLAGAVRHEPDPPAGAAPGSALLCCCLLYTSPSPRDLSTSRMPSSA